MILIDQHWNDESGAPEGGVTQGTGFTISWQRGPLGRGEDRVEPNGAFVEDVISAAMARLEHYQASPFACRENDTALSYLFAARRVLHFRTQRREAEGVEGTLEGPEANREIERRIVDSENYDGVGDVMRWVREVCRLQVDLPGEVDATRALFTISNEDIVQFPIHHGDVLVRYPRHLMVEIEGALPYQIAIPPPEAR